MKIQTIILIAFIINLNLVFALNESQSMEKINLNVQIVDMDVGAGGYSPNSFVLKKGVPVKWNVNLKQLNGCNSELVMNDYNVDARLKKGINVFEFTPDKTGTIRFSCGMGMIRGSFIVTETGLNDNQDIGIFARLLNWLRNLFN